MDTSSTVVPWELARRLRVAGITLDAVHVGKCKMDKHLHALAKSTGGYVFKPTSIHNALRLHELEVVLHGPERPPRTRLPNVNSLHGLEYFSCARFPVDQADDTAVPARRQPPQLSSP